MTGPELPGAELLGKDPEFALFGPADETTGIDVGGIAEFIGPMINI